MCASCNKVCASSIELDRKSHFTHTRELQQADIFDDLKVVQSHFTHTRELQRQRLARVNVKRDVSFHTHARVATMIVNYIQAHQPVSFHTHARVATAEIVQTSQHRYSVFCRICSHILYEMALSPLMERDFWCEPLSIFMCTYGSHPVRICEPWLCLSATSAYKYVLR